VKVINCITTANGVRAPRVPADWIKCRNVSNSTGAAPADAAGSPIFCYLEDPTPPGGKDYPDTVCLRRVREIIANNPGVPVLAYLTRQPRGYLTIEDFRLDDRTAALRACTNDLDIALYRLIASTGGALCPEIYPKWLDPATIKLYTMRRTAWSVAMGPTMPTVCWRTLPPDIDPVLEPWSVPQFQAKIDGMRDGGAAGYVQWDWLTSEAEVDQFEKWVGENYPQAE